MASSASQSLLAPRRSRLGRYIGLSVGLHVLVVVAGVALSSLERRPRIDLDQKPIKATLVRLGKKRDQKLLPRKEQPPPPPKEVQGPPPAPAEPPPPAPPPKAAAVVPVPDPTPTRPAPAQKGEKTGEERKKALFSAFDRIAQKAPSEEEPEGAEDGHELGTSAQEEGERYYALLQAQVQRHYNLPTTISDEERLYLKALVRLRIGRTGELLNADVVKGSNNTQFDNAVLAAAKRASPFSPPPEHLRSMLQSSGIAMEFSP